MSTQVREDKMKIIEKEYNAITGEETVTERDETAAEKTAREAHAAEILVMQEASAKKAIEKAALLTKLGITNDEAKLLLS